jgi:LTXXQ motif family protein
MNRATFFAIASLTTLAIGALSYPTAFAQDQNDKSPGMGMGHGMMGSDKSEGMMGGGGMMGHGMMGGGGMMGMMGRGCPMMGMMMGGGGDMPMYREGRIAFLKAELAITDAQANVWNAYAEALKKNMQSMQDMHKTMMAVRTAKTPVERLDAHVTTMEGRLQALKDIKPALAALYDALSDDQKKKADQLLTGMGCMM